VDRVVPFGSHPADRIQRSTICDTAGPVWSCARIRSESTLVGMFCTLANVVARHGLQMHQYANSIQIYTYTTVNDASSAVDRFTTCLTDVKAWLRPSQLRPNPTRPSLGQQLAKLDITHVCVLSSCLRVHDTVCDLGVVIDSLLSLSAHVAAVCRSGYQLWQAVRSLSEDATASRCQCRRASPVAWTTATMFFGIS